MNLKQHWSGFFMLLCLVLLSVTVGLRFFNPPVLAPDATFKTITGQKIKLQELKGHPVIITFWATDCPACIKEIPQLIELYNKFYEQGLHIIAVAMYYDPPNHVVTMTRLQNIPYHVALDMRAKHAKAFGNVRLIPTTFLIAPDGSIASQTVGEFDTLNMKAKIETFLEG